MSGIETLFLSGYNKTNSGKRRGLIMKKIIIITGLCLIGILLSDPVHAKQDIVIRVAVAANFQRPMKELAAMFQKRTVVRIEASYASTGTLYAQIINGAPYDLFLAADTKRPRLLFEKGLALRPVTYAKGKVVLWTRQKRLCRAYTSWKHAIKAGDLSRIAIANPETAPYGLAAQKALEAQGLWSTMAQRFLYAQSVSQSFQFAQKGGADAAFTSLSFALSPKSKIGCFWDIPEAPDVVQGACILRRGNAQRYSKRLLEFITSKEAAPVLKKYGYK